MKNGGSLLTQRKATFRLSWLAALLLAVTTASPGRRLFEHRPTPRASLAQPIKPLQSQAKHETTAFPLRGNAAPALPLHGNAALAPATTPDANRTVLLLRRAQLLREIAEIDARLAHERDARRAALTAEYEKRLAALDNEEDAPALDGVEAGGDGKGVLHGKLAAAILAAHSRDALGSHQHVAHQDVDIDVVLTHIDADGDGIISKTEANSASAGAAFGRFWPNVTVGCLAGVLCYLACRFAACSRGLRAQQPAAVVLSGGRCKGSEAVVPPAQQARMRRSSKKGCAGEAVAC
uniref:EF-hand domain-containing protein n=1 Tax=Calcidiscus leptoporus TaxID=127549 RepID=A0A7S0NV91_9EUKA